MFNAYQSITDQIIAELGKGNIPWRRAWTSLMPQSIMGKEYRGMNTFILMSKPYQDPRWLTYRKSIEMGGRVKKGEKGTHVHFWHFARKENEEGTVTRTIPMLKIYTVFNVEQCEDLSGLKDLNMDRCDGTPVDKAEQVIANLPFALTIKDDKYAAWSELEPDTIKMPPAKRFDSMDEYYSTLFHEVAHATGYETRLKRDMSGRMGSNPYALEELVAELTSAFLCAECGIDNTLKNSAAYIKGWNQSFQNDPKMILKASGMAQKAADYILNRMYEAKEVQDTQEAVA